MDAAPHPDLEILYFNQALLLPLDVARVAKIHQCRRGLGPVLLLLPPKRAAAVVEIYKSIHHLFAAAPKKSQSLNRF